MLDIVPSVIVPAFVEREEVEVDVVPRGARVVDGCGCGEVAVTVEVLLGKGRTANGSRAKIFFESGYKTETLCLGR